jgi:DNA-binding transcriptional ArsR family regulator
MTQALQDARLDQIFGALADATRRSILARLAGGEATVNELAAPLPMSLPSVSKHLKVLEGAGLITRGRDAQWRPCRLEAAPLRAVDAWLERYRRHWEGSFDKMSALLAELQRPGPTDAAPTGPRAGTRRRRAAGASEPSGAPGASAAAASGAPPAASGGAPGASGAPGPSGGRPRRIHKPRTRKGGRR